MNRNIIFCRLYLSPLLYITAVNISCSMIIMPKEKSHIEFAKY